MLDHIGLTVSDFARARAFYDAALAPLGVAPERRAGQHGALYGDAVVAWSRQRAARRFCQAMASG